MGHMSARRALLLMRHFEEELVYSKKVTAKDYYDVLVSNQVWPVNCSLGRLSQIITETKRDRIRFDAPIDTRIEDCQRGLTNWRDNLYTSKKIVY